MHKLNHFEQIKKLFTQETTQFIPAYREHLKEINDIETISSLGAFLKSTKLNLESKKIKLALLSNFTCINIENYLHALLLSQGIELEFLSVAASELAQCTIDADSKIYQFKPDVILILLDEQLICERLPVPWLASKHLANAVKETQEFIKQILNNLIQNTEALVLINTLLLSANVLNQIIDYRSKAWATLYINELNQDLIKRSLEHKQIITLDTTLFLQSEQVVALKDERLALFAQMNFHESLLYKFASEITKIICAKLGKTKKCLVLDLDNTIWGGIIGDDEVDGIVLGGSYEGYAYKKFQYAVQQLRAQGVLLAVNSKNNIDNVIEAFNLHPEMVLKLNDFVAMRINWSPKHNNLTELSEELNLGVDSFVFVDDNKAECELIKKYLPEVSCINLSEDPALYINEVFDLGFFNKLELTDEDLIRTADYQTEYKRKELLKSYQSIEEYLHNLNINLKVFIPNALELARIAQITLRTNQFNLTGKRYSEQEVAHLLQSDAWWVLGIETTDRFGKNGIVGAIFIEIIGECFYIRNFLLSCRVFAREIENAALRIILNFAKAKHIKVVRGEYISTQKNKSFKDFYVQNGFNLEKAQDSYAEFKHDLVEILHPPAWINVHSILLEQPQ